jgi:heptosyltransferase-3
MIKTALFLKTKNIGDSIILTSSIAALPKTFKYVDVMCLPESVSIFKMNPRVRNIFVIPRHLKGLQKLSSYYKIFKTLIHNRYDFLAQFSVDWRGALLARLLNADVSVAREVARRGSFWHQSFDFIASFKDNRPVAEQDVDLLRVAKLYQKLEAPSYQLKAPQKNELKIKKWLQTQKISLKKNLIVIHASSRWKFKEIPTETWANIIDALKSKKIHVVLSGSKDDLKTNQAILNRCKSKPMLTNNFSIEDTAALYKAADLVVTIDSMSTHLASAMKTPVVSIFGPTNDLNWRPWGVKYKVVALSKADDPTFACRPCGMDGCEGTKISQCLVQLKPEMILKSIQAILKKN